MSPEPPSKTLSAIVRGGAFLGFSLLMVGIGGMNRNAAQGVVPEGSAGRLREQAFRLAPSFEVNRGQAPSEYVYLSKGRGFELCLKPDGAVWQLPAPSDSAEGAVTLQMTLEGAKETTSSEGLSPLATRSSYFLGDDPDKWITDVPHYAQVRCPDVYPGTDVLYYGEPGRIEHDYVLHPGADPSAIRVSFDGVEGLTVGPAGQLILTTTAGDLEQTPPVAYQEIEGDRVLVAASYQLTGKDTFQFNVGAYDQSRELVIDPGLIYFTYLGGTLDDEGCGVAVANDGKIFVTGYTKSLVFPFQRSVTPVPGADVTAGRSRGPEDVFVTKIDPTLGANGVVYSAYVGGSNTDVGREIAVDNSGNAYVVGSTSSGNFATTASRYSALVGGQDVCLFKLDSAGTSLLYSTYLGGNSTDEGYGLALGASSGHVYITGNTTKSTTLFPRSTGAYSTTHAGAADAFVSRINTSASGVASLVYSTLIGGTSNDSGFDIALDASENVYVAGTSWNSTFPTLFPAQTYRAGIDMIAFKLTPAGAGASDLVYSTFWGGNGADYARGIAVDGSGNAYVVGYTQSTNFTTTANAYDTTLNVTGSTNYDAALFKVDAAGSTVSYSTYLGGSATEELLKVAVSSSGIVYATGWTGTRENEALAANQWPVRKAVQSVHGGTNSNADAVVVSFDLSQSGDASLFSSTFLGSSGNDRGQNIALLESLDDTYIHVAGWTQSDAPFTTATAQLAPYDSVRRGNKDAFVVKLSNNTPPVAAAGVDQAIGCAAHSNPVTLDGTASFDEDPGDSIVSYAWYLDTNRDGTGDVLIGSTAVVNTSVSYGVDGINWFVLVVTDTKSATGKDTVIVTLVDSDAPSFSPAVTSPMELSPTDPDCSADYDPTTPAAVDVCSSTVAVVGVRSDSLHLTSDNYPLGSTTITWTASDAAGNSTVVDQVITVADTTPPTFITCPENRSVVAGVGDDSASVYMDFPLVSDDCGLLAVEGYRDNAASPDDPITAAGSHDFPLGTTIITWIAIDTFINVTTCETRVTVLDPANLAVTSSLDVDAEGWTVDGDAVGPSYLSSGGNPGGYISGENSSTLDWYFVAPVSGSPDFGGDKSSFYGSLLEFDLRQNTDTVQVDTDDDVVLTGGGITLTYDLANPGTSWTFYRLYLHETGGWISSATGLSATEAEVQQVLANVTAFKIRGKWNNSGNVCDLDNVKFGVPYEAP